MNQEQAGLDLPSGQLFLHFPWNFLHALEWATGSAEGSVTLATVGQDASCSTSNYNKSDFNYATEQTAQASSRRLGAREKRTLCAPLMDSRKKDRLGGRGGLRANRLQSARKYRLPSVVFLPLVIPFSVVEDANARVPIQARWERSRAARLAALYFHTFSLIRWRFVRSTNPGRSLSRKSQALRVFDSSSSCGDRH